MIPRSKKEWLTYLETCHPKSIDLGLERIKQVGARLEVLRFDCPIIIVAGTNGKGSCVALTTAILTAAGYRVGSYTSPHLINYNERIQIDNQPVSDAALCETFTQIEKARGSISLTYFEFGTLAALCLFKQAQLNAILLEVGLGGRLDAVNCVDADISMISMIDFDHMEWLGHTRELIAKEKAGIMRANKPCVVGDFNPPRTIYDHAALINTPLYLQGKGFSYKKHHSTWSWESQKQTLTQLPLPTILLQNAATVLQTIELFANQFFIPKNAIEEGLKRVFLPGRFQHVEKNSIPFILDVAHNPAGGRCLARQLAQHHSNGETYAIVGMLKDKDIMNTLTPLIKQIDHWYLADLEEPRGATAEQLNQCVSKLNPAAFCRQFSSPVSAYHHACHAAQPTDRILVLGSFHTVGPILEKINAPF